MRTHTNFILGAYKRRVNHDAVTWALVYDFVLK